MNVIGRRLFNLKSSPRPQSISVIIPCLNEGNYLRQTVESLGMCSARPNEIIVVDNGSTDGCSDFIETENYPGSIRLFKLPSPLGVAQARNFGAAQATGDILIFVDAHVLFPQAWLPPVANVLSTTLSFD